MDSQPRTRFDLLIEEGKHREGELCSSSLFVELDETVFFQEARHISTLRLLIRVFSMISSKSRHFPSLSNSKISSTTNKIGSSFKSGN